MNHGIHYVSICWTFVFVSHCMLPDRCTAEVNAQMRDHCQSTCRFVSNVFSVFFHWMRPSDVYCWRSSCLDLGTARVIIPQLTSDPVSTTHQISIWSTPTQIYHNWLLIRPRQLIRSRFSQRPRYYTTIDFWSGLAHPSDAKSSGISQMFLSQYDKFGV